MEMEFDIQKEPMLIIPRELFEDESEEIEEMEKELILNDDDIEMLRNNFNVTKYKPEWDILGIK